MLWRGLKVVLREMTQDEVEREIVAPTEMGILYKSSPTEMKGLKWVLANGPAQEFPCVPQDEVGHDN